MAIVKRWAFYPLLALVCVVVGASVGDGKHENTVGMLVGLAVSFVFAFLVDRRRQRHRSAGLRP